MSHNSMCPYDLLQEWLFFYVAGEQPNANYKSII
jgi:hypothetical protein